MRPLVALLALLVLRITTASAADLPHPVRNPESPVMLSGSWAPEDHHRIDFDHLPRMLVEHVVVSDANPTNGVKQHNYLLHRDGRFWAMWSAVCVNLLATPCPCAS